MHHRFRQPVLPAFLYVAAYAGGDFAPLYVDRCGAIRAETPDHTLWAHTVFDLLGLGEPSFPTDDYVGNLIASDKETFAR